MQLRSPFFRSSLAASALLGLTGSAFAEASADEIALLREQIRQLDQKLRVLERKQEIKDETAAAAPKIPTPVAGAGGFGITSADKAFDLKIKALAQFDGRFFFDDGAPNRNSFLLRRVRTILSGTIAKNYEFNITPELGTGTNNTTSVGLWDAFLAARFTPTFNARFGKFPSAVGLEPGANRHFIESAFVNALLPNRDIGAEVYGTVASWVDYRLGVFNGAANNTTNFGGPAADYADGDKTLAGRVTVAPFKDSDSSLSALSLGVGFSVGNERGTAGTNLSNGLANISSNSQQAIFSYGSTLFSNGRHTRVSPSLEWYPAGLPFSAAAEYAWAQQNIAVNAAGLTREFENSAWRVSGGWVLTGEDSAKAGVTPLNPFDLSKGAWGAFEVVGRVSGLDLDSKLFRSVADGGAGLSRVNNATSAFGVGAGLNWYLNRNFRFLFNVEHTSYKGASTPTAQIGAQDDELAVISRAQLSF